MAGAYEVDESELRWDRTEFGIGEEIYELRTIDGVIGVLQLRGSLVVRAEVETDDGSWTFQPDGLLRSRLKIRDQKSDAVVATYEGRSARSLVRGVLSFSDGRQLQWLKERSRGGIWAFSNDRSQQLVRFRERGEQRSVTELVDGCETEPELLLVLMLGFYLRRLGMEEDKAEAKRQERRRRRKALQKKIVRIGFTRFLEQARLAASPPAVVSRWDRNKVQGVARSNGAASPSREVSRWDRIRG